MSWTVPSDLRHPEPTPDHADPSTWRTCIAPYCMTKVDPWDHHFRCDEHRPTVTTVERRHVAVITADAVRSAIDVATVGDDTYPRRLLDAVTGEAPSLVARVMLDLQRDGP